MLFRSRKEFFYWTDDGGLAGLRYDRWKLAFMEQRHHGFDVWQEPMVTLRLPKLFDLRADPAEKKDVAAEHPQEVARLSRQLRAWQESVLASLTGADYR